jgi:hypothetical protein
MLTGRKLALTLAFVVLIGLAAGVSCKGFFVPPTLSSISVGPPTPTIETGVAGSSGTYVQMYATGIDNQGNSETPAVSWSSEYPTTIASITAGGMVNALAVGTSTITATSTQNTAISGTQLVTVTAGCITGITLNSTSESLTNDSTTVPLTATAATCTTPQDITDVANWNSTETAVATVAAGVVTAVGNGTTIVTASSGNYTSNQCRVTVTGF